MKNPKSEEAIAHRAKTQLVINIIIIEPIRRAEALTSVTTLLLSDCEIRSTSFVTLLKTSP